MIIRISNLILSFKTPGFLVPLTHMTHTTRTMACNDWMLPGVMLVQA
ncbi:hypothetical protein [Dictyobacter arantiisoli]|nr:hypothetical protein [Dictyobacter arantiisoli]